MQVREVDLAEAFELDLVRQLALHDRRELGLGDLPALQFVQGMLSTLLCRRLQRLTEHTGVSAHFRVPAGKRLPQRIREHTAEVGDDRADLAHAAAGAGTRTVSS